MAICLVNGSNDKDGVNAISLLEELLAKYPKGLTIIIEEGENYRVDNYVPNKIRELKIKYLYSK